MKFKKGNMWDVFEESDLFLITANSSINKKGELVMGRGIALEVKKRFPTFPKRAGYEISLATKFHPRYGITESLPGIPSQLRCFQVKYNWHDNANLDLIEYSTHLLSLVVKGGYYSNVHLNYPGIGYGHLSKKQVQPILEKYLSDLDQITIWEK
jgi:hypothetical protein